MATGPVNVDVKNIIQELVNRPGWASGNAINLRARDEAFVAGNGTLLNFADYPNAGYGVLQVNYTEYTAHNQVQFDGNNDRLRRGANIFASDPKSVVIYADLTTPEKVDTIASICGVTALLLRLYLDNLGNLNLMHSSSTIDTINQTFGGLFKASTRYRLAVCIQCDTADSAADGFSKIWLSEAGGAWSLVADIPVSSISDSTTMGLSGGTDFTLFSNPTANNQYWGRVSDATKIDGAPVGFFGLWASTSRTGAIITDPSIFFSGGKDRNLAIDLTVGGVLPAPLVAFGGTQTAANWNAGTNLGTAGNFTMSGDVT